MNVVAIHGSYHRDGNISKLVDLVLEGARDAGATQTEKIALIHKSIQFCQNCKICFDNMSSDYKAYRCPTPDEMEEIIELIDKADHLILASPVNLGAVTALFKRFSERCVAAGKIVKLKDAKVSHPETVIWGTSMENIPPSLRDLPISLPRRPLIIGKRKCIIITSAICPPEMIEKTTMLDHTFGILEDTAKILGFLVSKKVAGIGITLQPIGKGNSAEKVAYEAGKGLGEI